MNPDEALAIACDRCVTAAALLAVARLPADANDHDIGRVLAAGVVCGWTDETSVGSADAKGVSVRERGGTTPLHLRWSQLAALVRPGLREPDLVCQLADAYGRYVRAATSTSVAARLEARVATAELAQIRRLVLERGRQGAPVQQSLFPPPPSRGRSLA